MSKSRFSLDMEDDRNSGDRPGVSGCVVMILYFIAVTALVAYLGYRFIEAMFAP